MKNIFIYLIISILLVANSAFAKVILNGSTDIKDIKLEENLFYLVDTNNTYTFIDVLSKEFENKFIQSEKATFFYKKGIHTHWYKIQLENQTHKDQVLILQVNNPFIQKINIFSTFNSTSYYTGAMFPYHQRQIDSPYFLYEIKLSSNSNGIICIKVEEQNRHLYVPFKLISKDEYFKQTRTNTLFNGIVYTLTLLSILFLIILYKSDKNKQLLFFLFLIINILLLSIWKDTLLFKWLWPNSPLFNYRLGDFFLPIIIMFTLFFVNIQLKIIKINKRLKQLFHITKYYSLFVLANLFFIKSENIQYMLFIVLAIGVTTISTWGILLRKKVENKLYPELFFAVIILNIYMLLTIFKCANINILGFDFIFNLEKIILIIFFFIVSYIFVLNFRLSRTKVVELNSNLEEMVDKRTSQLKAQQEELKSQHEELILQKEVLQVQREELRAQKELLILKNKELKKLSLIASKTNNLIYIFKPDGELDWYNSSFNFVMEMSYDEYKKLEPRNIINFSLNKNIKHVLNTCLQEKTMASYESIYTTEDNVELWFHTTLTPILNSKNEVALFIAIDTDITKLKQYESQLSEQKEEAESQKQLAIKHKEELEEQQKEITDSIRYAKRIQSAIIPKVRQIQRDFADSFVLFLPKDIVSGDFYWYHRIGDKYFIAAVDCTGHGVPGAFMSIIGNYLLNSIIIHNGVHDPAEILKHLNRKIKISLQSEGRDENSDGMDISIAVIDKKENTLDYSGALRPMFLFNNDNFIEAKGDKIPITSGMSNIMLSSFKTQHYPFNHGDRFYLFSDGIIDQFGGERGKKFLTKRFKQLLFNINKLPMKEQKEHIKKALDDWKGLNKQVDDILVMGIKY